MHAQDLAHYHQRRAQEEVDRGLTATIIAVSRAHLQVAALHMQRLRELSGRSGRNNAILTI